jgi:N6-L-threonylcarbamoyladenine synthase
MGEHRAELTVLGIETSCDETAAAVVRGAAPGPGVILSNVIHCQIAAHEPYGGVVPEIAARAHVELLDGIIDRALREAQIELSELDGIAATAGPGLVGGVMVGLLSGKALALGAGKPLIAVNHLEAHALTTRLVEGTKFPYLLLLISGGHCQLMAAEGVGRYRLYGATIDDALGEAFDKVAKLLGLPYPGGPEIERAAREGNPKRFAFPRPMKGRPEMDFSFSGLKTAVRHAVEAAHRADGPSGRTLTADIAASFQAAAIETVVDRISVAMEEYRTSFDESAGELKLVVAGGVAANQAIRKALEELAERRGFRLSVPPPSLCTDNAAMVAWAGIERLGLGQIDTLDSAPKARWALEAFEN